MKTINAVMRGGGPADGATRQIDIEDDWSSVRFIYIDVKTGIKHAYGARLDGVIGEPFEMQYVGPDESQQPETRSRC